MTDIPGFVGRPLAEFTLAQGSEVAGKLRWRNGGKPLERTLTDPVDSWRRRLASQPA